MARAPRKTPIPTGPGACRLCSRHENAQFVCMPGYGSLQPELVLVGEAPAREEDRVGKPFIGPAGKLLDRALIDAGFNPERVFKTNLVRCPGFVNGKSTNPTMLQVRKCKFYLTDELATLDYSYCKGIVLLGQTAVRGVLDDGFLTIKEARLRELDKHGPSLPVPLRCSYHPAAALPGRNPSLYDEIVEDLKSVFKPREAAKPIRTVNTPRDLEQVCPHPTILGLDLEWTKDGTIRLAGISNGQINAICRDVKTILRWLKEAKHVQT